jgi:hypothetical protein
MESPGNPNVRPSVFQGSMGTGIFQKKYSVETGENEDDDID